MIKKILLIGLSLGLLGLATKFLKQQRQQEPKANLAKDYMLYRKRFNKMLSTPEDFHYRLSIYAQNMKVIEESNKQGKGFELGEGPFTDLTFEEFKEKYLSKEILPNEQKFLHEGEIPKGEKDWNKEGKVSPVRNQLSCGSCWAFSAVGTLESAYWIYKNSDIILAPQELVDCSTKQGNNGCNGGLMTNAYDYVKDQNLALEVDYPYQGQDGHCHVHTDKPRFNITGYKLLEPVDVSGLVAALNNAPVAVAIEVQHDFMHYKSGVYKNADCGSSLNHGVMAAGYVNNGTDSYFIVKNSWDVTWGEKGFVRMEIGTGSGTCGIANNWDTYPTL